LSQAGNKAALVSKLASEDARLMSKNAPPPPTQMSRPAQSAPQRAYSSGSIWGTNAGDKFAHKRGTTFNVKIPEEVEYAEEGAPIPLLPQNYGMGTPRNEDDLGFTPRVLTVASASTHLAGGPSHNLTGVADAHSHELGHGDAFEYVVEEVIPAWWTNIQKNWTLGLFDDTASETAEAAKNAAEKAVEKTRSVIDDVLKVPPLSDTTWDKPAVGDLTAEEKTGLWVLLGILVTGGTLGSLAKPKKKHSHQEKEEAKH